MIVNLWVFLTAGVIFTVPFLIIIANNAHNTNRIKDVINLNGLNFTIAALFSIPIASYCSIKRLALDNLFS